MRGNHGWLFVSLLARVVVTRLGNSLHAGSTSAAAASPAILLPKTSVLLEQRLMGLPKRVQGKKNVPWFAGYGRAQVTAASKVTRMYLESISDVES